MRGALARRRVASCGGAVLIVLVGCGGSTSTTTRSGEAGGADGGGSSGGQAVCNDVADLSEHVVMRDTVLNATAPPSTGGEIADGTYVLTSWVRYLSGDLQDAVAVGVTRFELVITATSTAGTYSVQTAGRSETFTTRGARLFVTKTCPAPRSWPPAEYQYTASDTQLALSIGYGEVHTFTKQ